MDVDRRASRLGVATAAVPVLSNAATVVVVGLVSSGALGPVRAPSTLETAIGLAFRANGLLTFGVLLVAPVVAFSLTFPEERDAGPVVAGFAVGAVVYGAGGAGVLSAASMEVLPGGHLRFAAWLTLLYGGAGALGALGGDTVGPLFRPPDGEDDRHPRW